MTPLYGHHNEETAYLVEDYPYGRLRCKIKYWLEKDDKKGFRFVAQTQNPKTFRWNAPKKSTYSLLAGCMFLDEKGHTKWEGLSAYDSAENVLKFIENFLQADLSNLLAWSLAKKIYCQKKIAGKAAFTILGEPQFPNEREMEEASQELLIWEKCINLLKKG